MVANLANDGVRDLFASFRIPAWHGLGNVFDETVTDYRRMLVLAGLDGWNVRKMPLMTESGIPVPGHYASVRDQITPEGVATIPMGVVGERYGTFQNENAFEILSILQPGERFETAGALGNGGRVFASIADERETVLDPSGVADVVRSYTLCTNSHDGTTPFRVKRTKVRVVCQNTWDMAAMGGTNILTVRHTGTAEARAKARAEIWALDAAYDMAFDTEAHALFAAKFSTKQFENAFTTLFPKPEKDVKGSMTKWENKRGLFMQAWNGEPNAGIKGTAWGAINALTEAAQWGRGMRDGDKGTEAFFSAGAGFDPAAANWRKDARALVMARAGL